MNCEQKNYSLLEGKKFLRICQRQKKTVMLRIGRKKIFDNWCSIPVPVPERQLEQLQQLHDLRKLSLCWDRWRHIETVLTFKKYVSLMESLVHEQQQQQQQHQQQQQQQQQQLRRERNPAWMLARLTSSKSSQKGGGSSGWWDSIELGSNPSDTYIFNSKGHLKDAIKSFLIWAFPGIFLGLFFPFSWYIVRLQLIDFQC